MTKPAKDIKADPTVTKILGIKRQPSEITDSTSAPFASLLPPLKKPKLMQIKPPTFLDPTQTPMQYTSPIIPHILAPTNLQLLGTNPIQHGVHHSAPPPRTPYMPLQIPLNHAPNAMFNPNVNTLSLDAILSTLGGLNNINTTQLDALKTLIFSTNDTHSPYGTQTPPSPSIVHSIPIIARRHVPIRPKPLLIPPRVPVPAIAHMPCIMPTVTPRAPTPVEPIANVALTRMDLDANGNVKHAASCHQCKTKKDVKILFYCTKTRPRAYDALKRKVTRCRKKYCESCMAKYYSYNDVSQLRSVKNMSGWCWECPACIGLCTCRACKRKKAKMNHTYSPQSNANSTPKTTTCPTENNTHNPVVVQYTEPKKVPGNPIRGSVQHTPERSIRPPLYKGGLIATLPGPKQTNNNNNVTLLYPQ
eukprot:575995_1